MPRFGMPALIELDSLEESAALCRELGLSFIELNMNFPQYQMDVMNMAHLRDIAQRYGIFYTLHLDDHMNVADFNPLVSGAYQDTVVAAVELANRLLGKPPVDFPQETAIGALALYISSGSVGDFQPMNVNFGLIPQLGYRVKGKRNKNAELSQRSLALIEGLKERL